MFEQLAAELVEEKGFPTNIAAGGADNGYDFELLDSALEPGPGVVTTSDRVTTNLRRNLERNKNSCPRAAKKTFVVTSSELTSRKRDNLKKAAHELGYMYLGAADRPEVARYILGHPHWAQELLGLTGQPSGLSVIPLSSRPLTNVPLVGREAAADRLRGIQGDALLIGSPGSGKTALLSQLTVSDGWSFMVTADMTAVANAVREQEPVVVVIDDLDDVVGATRELMRLRKEIGASFKIVVTSWDTDPELRQVLGLSDADIIKLQRLTRDEIVSVVASVGVGGPRVLVREIVDQAEGVPGLAVTLTQAALAGDVPALFDGSRLGLLMESTVNGLLGNPREGDRAVLVLGAIALAGDPGLTLEEAAEYVGISKGELLGLLMRLTSGGVIRSDHRRVSLRPRPLRRYMIRKAFFGVAASDYASLLQVVPDPGEAAKELVLAARAGAAVPNLLGLVLASGSTKAAGYYAGSGAREARGLLQAAPELAIDVATPALHTAPETIIPLLLDLAVGDQRELHSTPTQPLRLIKDWAKAGVAGGGDAVSRRRNAIESALAWATSGGDLNTACRTCAEVLRTTYENTETDPGAGMTLTMVTGMLTEEEIAQLAPLWDALRGAIEAGEDVPWPNLLSLCWDLVHPYLSGGGKPKEAVEASRRLAEAVIDDLGRLAELHPGVLDRLNTMRRRLGHRDLYAIPEDYAVLFGEHERDDWGLDEQERGERIERLADEWSEKDPTEFATRLTWLQQEAALLGGGVYDRSPQLCQLIAEKADEPQVWLTLLAEARVSPVNLLPFLERPVRDNAEGWEAIALPVLNDPDLEYAAVDVALRAPQISDAMWSTLGPMLARYSQTVEVLCLRKQVATSTLERLLHHESNDVTRATATGMWNGEPHGSIPPELRPAWEDAVVAIDDDEYWLKEMLAGNPTLAARWLEERIRHDDWRAVSNRENVLVAAAQLNDEQRLSMLGSLPVYIFHDDVVTALVGDSDDVYRHVLADTMPNSHWKDPLRRRADETWRRFAGIALEQRTPLAVAQASFPHSDSWTGPYSVHLQEQIDEFSLWLGDPEEGVREVARIMVERLSASREAAIAEEHDEAVEGID